MADGFLVVVYVGDNNVLGIDLGLEEKAMMDAILALANSVGSCGGDNGGFSGDHGKQKELKEKINALKTIPYWQLNRFDKKPINCTVGNI